MKMTSEPPNEEFPPGGHKVNPMNINVRIREAVTNKKIKLIYMS